MRRLVWACVVHKPPKTGFLTSRPIYAFVLILCMSIMYAFVYHLYLLNKIIIFKLNCWLKRNVSLKKQKVSIRTLKPKIITYNILPASLMHQLGCFIEDLSVCVKYWNSIIGPYTDLGMIVEKIGISCKPDWVCHCFYPFEKILSHIPMHTRSSDPYVSSLSEKSVPHRYPCKISVSNTR